MGLSLDELLEHQPKSHPDEAIWREWHEEDISTTLRELRGDANPMTYIDISVVVPFCDPCCWTDEHKPFPLVWGPDWLEGYKMLGLLTRSQIAAVARALRNGSWLPTCWQCGSSIDLHGEEGFHIRRVSFSGFDQRVGHFRPPRMMGGVPKLPFPQSVRCFYLGHRLLGWPTP